jgi:hypothetical protein
MQYIASKKPESDSFQSKIQDAFTGFRRFAGVLDKRLDGKKPLG